MYKIQVTDRKKKLNEKMSKSSQMSLNEQNRTQQRDSKEKKFEKTKITKHIVNKQP